MTYNEMFSGLIEKICERRGIVDDSVLDSLIDGDIQQAGVNLIGLLNGKTRYFFIQLNLLYEYYQKKDQSELDRDRVLNGEVRILDFSQNELHKKNRAFAHATGVFGFFSLKNLIKDGHIVEFTNSNKLVSKNEVMIRQITDFIMLCLINNEDEKLINLFESVDDNSNKGFLILKTNDFIGINNNEKIYSYLYLDYLNSGAYIEVPVELKYSSGNLHERSSFSNESNYEQFFEIYDVLNELNQVEDVISRFLKLYHTLEYISYRVYIVDFVKKVNTNRFLVREYINSLQGVGRTEKDSFRKSFKRIFHENTADILSAITDLNQEPVKKFLRENKIHEIEGAVDLDDISDIIYGLRCAIVHNNESEFHFTLTNHDDYSVVTNLFKQIIGTFEKFVVSSILTSNEHIRYNRREIQLY